MRPITRRRLLAAAGVALPVALWPLEPWRALVEVAPPLGAAGRLSGVLGERESARAIGREYLRLAPAAEDELAAAVTAQLSRRRVTLARAGDAELRGALAGCVHEDFEADEVVVVRGWVLSRTEARLCALVALAEDRRG